MMGAAQNFVFTPQARAAHQPRAASNARNADASARQAPAVVDADQTKIAVVPITIAPAARMSRPLLSMLEAKRFDFSFFIN